jgi:hypothetical protein
MWKKCADNKGDWKNNLNFVGHTHDKCIFPISTVSEKIWRYHYHAAAHNKKNTQHSKERQEKYIQRNRYPPILINNKKLKDPRQLTDVPNFL